MAHKTRTPGIYAIKAPSGKMYIGQSIDVEKRLQRHRSMLRSGTHPNTRVAGAYRKYGDRLVFELLEACAVADLDAREQHWIDTSNCPYNMSRVAKNPLSDPAVVAKVSRAKIRSGSAAAASKRLWESAEYRQRVIAAMQLAFSNPEVRARQRAAARLASSAPEVRARHSAALRAAHAAGKFDGCQKAAWTAERKKSFGQAVRDRLALPEAHAAILERLAVLRADPDVQARRLAGLASKRQQISAAISAAAAARKSAGIPHPNQTEAFKSAQSQRMREWWALRKEKA